MWAASGQLSVKICSSSLQTAKTYDDVRIVDIQDVWQIDVLHHHDEDLIHLQPLQLPEPMAATRRDIHEILNGNDDRQ